MGFKACLGLFGFTSGLGVHLGLELRVVIYIYIYIYIGFLSALLPTGVCLKQSRVWATLQFL